MFHKLKVQNWPFALKFGFPIILLFVSILVLGYSAMNVNERMTVSKADLFKGLNDNTATIE